MSQDTKDIAWLLREKYNGEKSEAFFADCKRLALGEPLGYLIGHVPFLDCQIWLDSHPLIPRTETEYWTEKAITELQQRPDTLPDLGLGRTPIKVLDLCAGSGCIGVAVAKAVPETLVDFAEIEKNHLPTIEKNIASNNIATNRTRVRQSNLFSAFADDVYDMVLSNPPYINADLNRVDDSVVNFEPHLALFGGSGGTEIIEQLIKEAPAHLTPNGQLWIEHEPEQASVIIHLAEQSGFSATAHNDQYGIQRYSILVLQ